MLQATVTDALHPSVGRAYDWSAHDCGGGATRANLDQVFRTHNHALVRFLQRRLGSAQDAHDVAQEAYVKMLGIGSSTAVGFLRAYLFKTAENLANNRIKYGGRRKQLDALVFFEVENVKSPEHRCAAEQDLEVIQRALQSLPERVSQAFSLVKFEEMPPEEAAAVLGMRGQMVRRYVAKGMACIMERLQTESDMSWLRPDASGQLPVDMTK